jgi:hypothetical protein
MMWGGRGNITSKRKSSEPFLTPFGFLAPAISRHFHTPEFLNIRLKVPCVLSGRRGWFRIEFKEAMNVQD